MRQRGDTIIEVILAVTVFSVVAVGGIGVMNQGVATAQRSLEIGLVRAQIDAQADALRYVHSTYVSSLGTVNPGAKDIWDAVAGNRAVAGAQDFREISDGKRCQPVVSSARAPAKPGSDGRTFAIDIRKVDGKATRNIAATTSSSPVLFFDSSIASSAEPVPINSTTDNNAAGFPVTYAQVRYKELDDPNTVAVSHGVWVQAVYSEGANTGGTTASLGYYDFNIRACWLAPGQQAPVTLGTVVRLYDPAV